jgi:hypothetical protein
MEFLRNLGLWIPALYRWFMELKRVWGLLIPIVVLIVVPYLPAFIPPEHPEARLRFCGLAFELFAILTVVSGLRDRQRLFNRPSYVKQFREWLKRRPRLGVKTQTILGTAAGSFGLAGMAGRLSVWRAMRPENPVEERLAALEANLTSLRTELEEEAKERRDEARKLAQAGDLERQARETSIKKLQDQLERFGAEGLNIEMVGVCWVVLGAIFTTLSGELASMATWVLSGLGALLHQVNA